MNILLTSIGRRSYLVKYFKEALGANGDVHVSNSVRTSPFHVADYGIVTPLICDQAYIPFLENYCIKNRISAIIPLFDIDCDVLAKEKKRFEELGMKVVVSDEEVIGICNDKWRMKDFLESEGFKVPTTALGLTEALKMLEGKRMQFPVIIKPRRGMGSIGIYYADNLEELTVLYGKCEKDIKETYLRYMVSSVEEKIIIQECIRGQEYGLDVINDMQGKVITCIVKKKLAMRGGETDGAVVVEDVELDKVGRQIGEKLGHIGNLDMDVMGFEGKNYILDMNARFGGGYPASHMAGINLPKAIICWLNKKVPDNECFKINIGTTVWKDMVPVAWRG